MLLFCNGGHFFFLLIYGGPKQKCINLQAGALGIAHCAVTEGKVDVILSEEHLISCDGGDDPCSGGLRI